MLPANVGPNKLLYGYLVRVYRKILGNKLSLVGVLLDQISD